MADFLESALFILLVAVLVVVLPMTWLIRRRRARKRKEKELTDLFELPYTGPRAFLFRFESTHRDLLDAYASHRLCVTGQSAVERTLVIGLGMFWVGCVIVFGPKAIKEGRWWQPIIPLCLGMGILWTRLFKPFLTRRRIRKANRTVQPLVVALGDSGIRIEAENLGVIDRAWEELESVEVAEKGVAIGFSDGVANWLPNRVFRGEEERRMCAAYLASMLPKEVEEDGVRPDSRRAEGEIA